MEKKEKRRVCLAMAVEKMKRDKGEGGRSPVVGGKWLGSPLVSGGNTTRD
jgi:hypothetical protein